MLERVSEEEKQRRLGVCQACENYRTSPYRTCIKCWCFLPGKASFRSSVCPLRKWSEQK